MSRRWKIVLALAVVGLAAFLVWAFKSPATPPFTIRFLGYMTNYTPRRISDTPPSNGYLLAVYGVTNQSTRWMDVRASADYQAKPIPVHINAVYVDVTRYDRAGNLWAPILKPGEGTRIGAEVYPTNQSVELTVVGWLFRPEESYWNRFLNWMARNEVPFSITVTNGPL